MMRFTCAPHLRCCRPWPLQQPARGVCAVGERVALSLVEGGHTVNLQTASLWVSHAVVKVLYAIVEAFISF